MLLLNDGFDFLGPHLDSERMSSCIIQFLLPVILKNWVFPDPFEDSFMANQACGKHSEMVITESLSPY